MGKAGVCVCVCGYVCKRDREGETHAESEPDTQRDRNMERKEDNGVRTLALPLTGCHSASWWVTLLICAMRTAQPLLRRVDVRIK